MLPISKGMGGTVACGRCVFYKVTWDPQHPFGCGAHRFKSARNPALAVFQSSGLQCQLFREKERAALSDSFTPAQPSLRR